MQLSRLIHSLVVAILYSICMRMVTTIKMQVGSSRCDEGNFVITYEYLCCHIVYSAPATSL